MDPRQGVRALRLRLLGRCPDTSRPARLRSVLLAALNTTYYAPLLRSAGLGSPDLVARLDSVADILSRLPKADPPPHHDQSRFLTNEKASGEASLEMFWPLPRPGRPAVLMQGFRGVKRIDTFGDARRQRLAHFRPDALAGPVAELRRLAEGAEDCGARLPKLTHSVIAFVILRQTFLSSEARDLLWRVFQAPVFGQILSPEGRLLAWECEAHDGFHIEGDQAILEVEAGDGEPELLATSLLDLRRPVLRLATGLTASIERATCACGLPGPRLTGVRRRSLTKELAASASCAAD